MKTIFADTGYWIALLDPQDTLHQSAIVSLLGCPVWTVHLSKLLSLKAKSTVKFLLPTP
jgi:hypothetical protein